MSDGLYMFESAGISGSVRVRSGVFRGENACYKYSGTFSIKNNELHGSISVESKRTMKAETLPLLAHVDDDGGLLMVLPIDGNEVTFFLTKARHKPLM